MKCQFTRLESGQWKCLDCGYTSKHAGEKAPNRMCGVEPSKRVKRVGDVLTRLVKPFSWLVWFKSGPCKCPEHAATLNEWGPQVTRERVNEVVGWLTEGLELMPFAAWEARRLVLQACDEVERWNAQNAS